VRSVAENNSNATTILQNFITAGEADVDREGIVTLSKKRALLPQEVDENNPDVASSFLLQQTDEFQ